MEKIKAFVKKSKDFVCAHKFWFIIGAIAIATALLFSPLFSFYQTGISYGSSDKTVINSKETYCQTPTPIVLNIFSAYYPNIVNLYYYDYSPLIIVFFCLVVTAIIGLIFYLIFKKNILLYLSCSINILSFIILVSELGRLSNIMNFSQIDDYYEAFGRVIPHAAFYFALLLFIVSIIVLAIIIYNAYRKKHPRTPTKSERITELEKRIEELENRKDGE